MARTASEKIESIALRLLDACKDARDAVEKIETLGAELEEAAHAAMVADELPVIFAHPISEFASDFKEIGFDRGASCSVDLVNEAREMLDLIERLTAPARTAA